MESIDLANVRYVLFLGFFFGLGSSSNTPRCIEQQFIEWWWRNVNRSPILYPM